MVPGKELEMKLAELKPSFYEMCLVDFVAERTPRTRSPDMAVCKKVTKAYLKRYPNALPKAIEAADGNLYKVIDKLEPSFLAFAKKVVADLLDKPAGLY
jgi:hypothetical protein